MQGEVRGFSDQCARQNGLELGSRLQPLHTGAKRSNLDGQTLAAFGTARIDHSAATAGFHANQKAMGTRAADFGGLICAFHLKFLRGLKEVKEDLGANMALIHCCFPSLSCLKQSPGSLPLSQTFCVPATP
jgi:hypothetical protein